MQNRPPHPSSVSFNLIYIIDIYKKKVFIQAILQACIFLSVEELLLDSVLKVKWASFDHFCCKCSITRGLSPCISGEKLLCGVRGAGETRRKTQREQLILHSLNNGGPACCSPRLSPQDVWLWNNKQKNELVGELLNALLLLLLLFLPFFLHARRLKSGISMRRKQLTLRNWIWSPWYKIA